MTAAFDVANSQVILYDLAKMDMGVDFCSGYLVTSFTESVLYCFKAKEVKLKKCNLALQGAELIPILFNKLINALLKSISESPRNITISDAYDIVVQNKTYCEHQTFLTAYTVCDSTDLISAEETRVLSGPSNLQLMTNPLTVSSHKYLDISVPHTVAAVQKLYPQCTDTLIAFFIVF